MSIFSQAPDYKSNLTYGNSESNNSIVSSAERDVEEIERDPVLVREWLLVFILLLLPVVNVIVVVYFVFFSKQSLSIRNFFRAYLVLLLLALAIGFLVSLFASNS